MTEAYEIGKIYGWNGGECPVHPETVVEVWFNDQPKKQRKADFFRWSKDATGLDTDIIAFQVVKEYVEPKVIWVNEYPTGNAVCPSKEAAHKVAGPGATRIAVKYVECKE